MISGLLLLAVLQVLPPQVACGNDPRPDRADSLFQMGDAEGALEVVEAFLGHCPGEYRGLLRAASLSVAVGMNREEAGKGDRALDHYRSGVPRAEEALEVHPESLEARYWRLTALRRTALSMGPRESVSLSDRIRDGALEILERDPDHAGAHNVLGRLDYETMSLSEISRFFGRALFRGEALGEASWERAEHHLRRAVEVAGSHPPDRIFVREARRLLGEWGG